MEVADLAGLDFAYLSRVERGQRQAAPLTKIRIARALGTQVAELFEPAGVIAE